MVVAPTTTAGSNSGEVVAADAPTTVCAGFVATHGNQERSEERSIEEGKGRELGRDLSWRSRLKKKRKQGEERVKGGAW